MTQETKVTTDPQRIIAQRIVQEASGVLRARGDVYGTLEEDFKITAGLWSAFFGIEILPDEVTQAMVLLKIGRTKSGVFSEDNYIDQAGYSGISAALADPSGWQEELDKSIELGPDKNRKQRWQGNPPEDPDEHLTKSPPALASTAPPSLGRSKTFGQGISQRGNVEGGTPKEDSYE